MANIHVFIGIVILICISNGVNGANESNGDDSKSNNGDEYVKEACKATRFHDLCIDSLAPFSNSAKQSPRKWAQAAVTVAMNEAKNISSYINTLYKNGHFRKRQKLALSDCLECFEETMENIHDSLGELSRLDVKTFDVQMGNVETWMSAALTYEDTCLDGFDGRRRGRGNEVKLLRGKVTKVAHVTSNALALVSKLAEVGGRSLDSTGME